MNKPEKRADDTAVMMSEIGVAAREAANVLALSERAAKDCALLNAADALRRSSSFIVRQNAIDLEAAKASGLADAFIDRLKLDDSRIEAMAQGLEAIADLDDPVSEIIADWRRPNKLKIERVRTPLGVIGVIYESRPNVTADAGALCLKAGNASILRGGSDSYHSSHAIHACLVEGLRSAGLPETSIQLVPTTDRRAVGEMLKGLGGQLDVIVPRGGKSLVARVQDEARVPVFAHLEGICHIYWDRGADPEDGLAIVLNSKLRRPGICGAAESLLVDKMAPSYHLECVVRALLDAGCEVRGDEATQAVDARVVPATESDWRTEYLDKVISVKLVDGVDEAISHIREFGSQHTDCILTECYGTAESFLRRIDSAIVLHNASTQFADGGEFGMGAEIGIATGKMHARGPVGVEQLTSFKYVVRGAGQVRPQ
ncbi:MAG: glutamate-5-semialdehyde dehydrogenase [Hyphomicrobiaceae bacterium]